ncbi:hypothetical protein MERGE_002386 [Pneumocystis wakefieldiae]|uniref:Major facilitator superfamily (MFS) profile domain-containing protein n=1 Tax=Pneumocystis wakefieldiae TaxID=38082 RepID=A0A899FTI1_9ASCO|nr:hypothetical protein MERGE_002386 [Pneumocystis wakefieldiae]
MLFSSLTQKKTSNQHEITSKQPEIAGQTGPAAYNNDLTGDCANLENKEDPATLGQLDNQAHTYTSASEIGEEMRVSVVEMDERTIKRTYRKLDASIIPCLWLLYFFAFSAKSIISVSLTMNYSNGDSLQQLIKLSSRQVSIGLSLFYIGYVVFEIPSNLIMMCLAPRFWLSETIILIGVACILHVYITNSFGFYVFRFLLGAIEAGIWPGMTYYLTLYYPIYMIQKLGFFRYKWMFLIYGIFSMIADLSPKKNCELHHLLLSPKEPWSFSKFMFVFIDPRIWLLIIMYFGSIGVGVAIQIYGSVIIQFIDSNISDLNISFLYGIIWIANLAGAIIIISISNYYKSQPMPFILCCSIVIIGMLVLTFLSNRWVQYIGLLISAFGIGASVPICMAWCAHIFVTQSNMNTATSSALLSSLGNLGSVFTTYALYKGMGGNDPFKKTEKLLLKYYKKSPKSHEKTQSIVNP